MPAILILLAVYWVWGVELRAWLTRTAAKLDNDPTNDPPADSSGGSSSSSGSSSGGTVTVSDGSGGSGPPGTIQQPRGGLNIPTGVNL